MHLETLIVKICLRKSQRSSNRYLSHKMGRDEDGLYVRTDFKQGWVGLKRCVKIWR